MNKNISTKQNNVLRTDTDLFGNFAVKKFNIQNRRYLGNKHKLLEFISEIIEKECNDSKIICDIFAGTGVVGAYFNKKNNTIISNDILSSNFVCLSTFLNIDNNYIDNILDKISYLNKLEPINDNYFSKNFGGTYFSIQNSRKIGLIREKIEEIEDENEKNILLCSLLYAVDKVANTVGHYDAYRKELDMTNNLELLIPEVDWASNTNNKVYKKDANELIKEIECDILYIDPPYNSRQYSDAYHLLENLIEWQKPEVVGVAKKMNRSHIKSQYCLRGATQAFADLIKNANCKHILLSYNNTGESKDDRSNARISDQDILDILNSKGEVKIYEKTYKPFTTGKSQTSNHTERIFYCKVKN